MSDTRKIIPPCPKCGYDFRDENTDYSAWMGKKPADGKLPMAVYPDGVNFEKKNRHYLNCHSNSVTL